MVGMRQVLFLTCFCVAVKAFYDEGFLSEPAPQCDWRIVRKIELLNRPAIPAHMNVTYFCEKSTDSEVYYGIKTWSMYFTEGRANYRVNGVPYSTPVKESFGVLYFRQAIAFPIWCTGEIDLRYLCTPFSGIIGTPAAAMITTKYAGLAEINQASAVAAHVGLPLVKTYYSEEEHKC